MRVKRETSGPGQHVGAGEGLYSLHPVSCFRSKPSLIQPLLGFISVTAVKQDFYFLL